MSDLHDAFAFCQSELKRLDSVRYFASLTAPEAVRADFLAFQCFLADVAVIPTRVSEPAMGDIRLTWWRDIVADATVDQSPGNEVVNVGPVASALQVVQHRHALPIDRLVPIIEARRFDLYNDPMPDMPHFETYAGETEALALMLSAQILCKDVADISGLCGHAAMAICLAQHLFDWPQNVERQKLFLPADAFAAHGLAQADLIADKSKANVAAALLTLGELAEMHHAKAMAELKLVPKDVRSQIAPAFLRLAPARLMIRMRKKHPARLLRLARWRCYGAIWRMAAAV
ncbi:phytoene/squalene synthase family protein [Cohaesibacter intestini]|uniref:phytoene/squalene synthase family protein n=1 Tax=Cohaesibacter intestini TaxID=2211145 RepID=UPI000DE97CA1|nr:squalene/phytoene synthase family protein [Cohaesibacter intestini]